jgi:hypothetical protein
MMPLKYVDAKTGGEISKEAFDAAKADAKTALDSAAKKEAERQQHRKELIYKTGEKLGLTPEDSLLLFGG